MVNQREIHTSCHLRVYHLIGKANFEQMITQKVLTSLIREKYTHPVILEFII